MCQIEKAYKGVKPSEFTPEPPAAPLAQPFTPLGFCEPGDPPIDYSLPVSIQFHKPVYIAGKQFQNIELKTEKTVRVQFDHDRGLVFVRVDTGTCIGVAVTPLCNLHCLHYGVNAKHVADEKAAA